MTLQLPFSLVDNPQQQANNEAIQLAWPTAGLSPTLPSQQSQGILAGVVAANGTLGVVGTGGWSSARTPAGAANGDYTVTFAASFASVNVVVELTLLAPGVLTFCWLAAAPTAATFRYITANAAGAAVDTAVHFMVMGARA